MLAIAIILSKFVHSFKCLWNQWLNKLKFSSVKICAANNLNPYTNTYIKPCKKYSDQKYCAEHSIKLAKACKQYHYISHLSHDDTLLHYWAQKELSERIVFCQRFSITSDYGHEKWNEHLRSIIKRYEQKTILYEKIKQERRMERLNRVFYDTVYSYQIKECPMTLFCADDYDSNKININSSNDTWNDDLFLKNENQLDKVTLNHYLFQYYFKRGNLSDLNYLNLIESKRKVNKNIDEEW